MAKASVTLTAELFRIVLGNSDLRPERNDWRFKDPTWDENPSKAPGPDATWHPAERFAHLLEDVSKPATDIAPRARLRDGHHHQRRCADQHSAWQSECPEADLRDGSANLVRGAGSLRHRPSPQRRHAVDGQARRALKVGQDLALTPGSVAQDEYAELLEYTPDDGAGLRRPLLSVPPPIGRYYFLDLRPGRSFVEYSVSRGLQTFLL